MSEHLGGMLQNQFAVPLVYISMALAMGQAQFSLPLFLNELIFYTHQPHELDTSPPFFDERQRHRELECLAKGLPAWK